MALNRQETIEPVGALIGRTDVWEQLTHARAAAIAGTAQVIEVQGGAGVGKTALLTAFVADSHAQMRVLPISGHPAEQTLPYAGMHQLLYASGEPLDADAFSETDPLRDAETVLHTLTRWADDRPLLLFVDDAQWLDAATRRALVFAARRLDAEPILLVFGFRSGMGERLDVGSVIELGPLSPAESMSLLAERHPELSARVAARVAEQSVGLPLALCEIPHDLTPAQRGGIDALPEVLPLGPSLTELFTRRVDALPDATRLAMLAASFDVLDADHYRRVLQLLGAALGDLDDAERAGLVRVVEGVCRFRHPSVPAAMRNLARARESIAVHRALATALRAMPIRTAAHLLQDPDAHPRDVLPTVLAGAEEATRLGSHAEAATLWEAAAARSHRLDAPMSERTQLRRAMDAHLRAGAAPEAQVIAERLLRDVDDPGERAALLRGLVTLSLWTRTGSPEDGESIEKEGVRLLDADDPALRDAGADLLTALTTAALSGGHYREAHRLASQLSSGRAELSLEQRLLEDVTAVMVGAPRAGAVLRGDWVSEYPWQRIHDPSTAAGFITVVLGWLGEYDTLDEVIRRSREILTQSGPSACALYVVDSMNGARDRPRGRWDNALAGFDALENLTIDTDFVAPYPFIALRHAHLLAARGDDEACERMRRRARERAPMWTPMMEHLDGAVAGLLALARRDFAAAAAHLAVAARIEHESGLIPSGYLSRVADAFEATWRLGTSDEMLEELELFETAMRAIDHPGLVGLAVRCRALMADPDGMDGLFEHAIELLADETDGFEIARTRMLWGERLRRARHRAAARVQLTLAQEAFLRLGATAWSEQCESELAACGVRRAAPASATTDLAAALTPREFEVAREVAAGSTNAEAARRLFVSERTAEFHLQSVFRKLDIHRRTDLADALGR